jgi:predicted ATPase
MITRLELTNFSVFKHLAIDFSPKINVIIGENGTGKTQLMKAAYALCGGNSAIEGRSKKSKTKLEDALASKLVRLFMPLDSKLGSLRRRGASGDANLEAHFALGEKLTVGFSNKSEKSVQLLENVNYEKYNHEPVFIPTKEVLSLIRGMSDPDSDQETLQRVFDDTYLDLCSLLLRNSTVVNDDRLDFDPRFGSIFPDIVNAISGKYRFSRRRIRFEEGKYEERKVENQDDEYSDKIETVFEPVKGSEVSNNMTAEGFRKIGTLQQLLANKSLSPGISGPLFWDEPECNMNPKLVRLLVEILLELSRNGQQIILATHDYVLLRWFDLLMDREKEDHVKFHSLYRERDTKEIKNTSTDNYLDIDPNPIDEAYGYLINQEIENEMGDLGK